MPSDRCGICNPCRHVAATQRIVLAETSQAANAGRAVDNATVRMWNNTLADNPCEDDQFAKAIRGVQSLCDDLAQAKD